MYLGSLKGFRNFDRYNPILQSKQPKCDLPTFIANPIEKYRKKYNDQFIRFILFDSIMTGNIGDYIANESNITNDAKYNYGVHESQLMSLVNFGQNIRKNHYKNC